MMKELETDRDWTEDFSMENGNYSNRCYECDQPFNGHKRRRICKKCSPQGKGYSLTNLIDQIETPCGKKIEVYSIDGKRVYIREGECIFDTRTTHRVELMAAIIKEDEIKFKERSKK